MSPELLDPKKFSASDPRPTKESDRFAMGMVIYEVRMCVWLLRDSRSSFFVDLTG